MVSWSEKKSFGSTEHSMFTSVAETASGDFMVTGMLLDENYDSHPFLIKFNKDGDKMWTKNGTVNDFYKSIIKTSNGELLLLTEALVPNTREIEPPKDRLKLKNRNHRVAYYNIDTVIKKINEDGNTLSEITFGGSGYDAMNHIKETSDNGFIVVGYSDSTDAGFYNKDLGMYYDAVIVKYSQDGTQQWIKGFGGDDEDYFSSVVETSDGGFIAIGTSYSSDIIYDNNSDYGIVTIVKYDSDGNRLWAKLLSGDSEIMASTAIESDNGFVVAGVDFDSKPLLAKFNNEGEVLWSKPIDNYISEEGLVSITKTLDGYYVAVGSHADIVQDASYGLIVKYGDTNNYEHVESVGQKKGISIEDYEDLRGKINLVPSLDLREMLNEKLNLTAVDLGGLELKKASANLDIYIKSENMLSLSLNTNSVSFENYSGVEPIEKLGAVNLTVNSSLPYQINAYMPTEISNSDGSERMPIDVLNIKEGNETDYQTFESITDKVVLKDGCTKGNGNVHSIDLKLASNQAHKADIYKTVIKFEAEQK